MGGDGPRGVKLQVELQGPQTPFSSLARTRQ